jgi:hypothetical protein
MPLRLGVGLTFEGTREGQTRRSRFSPSANGDQPDADDEQDGAGGQEARERGAHRARSFGQVPASCAHDHSTEKDAEHGDEEHTAGLIVDPTRRLRPHELHRFHRSE